jgi:hypothetical protein
MANKSHNGSSAATAKVQVGVNAALGLFFDRLRKIGFTSADAKRLLRKMCRDAIKDLEKG